MNPNSQHWGLLPNPTVPQTNSQLFPSANNRNQPYYNPNQGYVDQRLPMNLNQRPTSNQSYRPPLNQQHPLTNTLYNAPPNHPQYYNQSQQSQPVTQPKSTRSNILDSIASSTGNSQVSSTIDNILKSIGIDTNQAKKKIDIPTIEQPSQYGIVENQMHSYVNRSSANHPVRVSPQPVLQEPYTSIRSHFQAPAPSSRPSYTDNPSNRQISRPYPAPEHTHPSSKRGGVSTFPLVNYASSPPSRQRSRSPFASSERQRYGEDVFSRAFSSHKRDSHIRKSISPSDHDSSPKQRRTLLEDNERRSNKRSRSDRSPSDRTFDYELLSKVTAALEQERADSRHMEDKMKRELRSMAEKLDYERDSVDKLTYSLDKFKRADRQRQELEEKDSEGNDIYYTYRDLGKFWCKDCRVISSSLNRALQHMSSPEHMAKMKGKEASWFTETPRPGRSTPIVDGGPIKGVELLRPTLAYYCEVCKVFSGDDNHAKQHLRTRSHNVLYQKYIATIPGYERQIVKDMEYELYQRRKDEEEDLVREDDIKTNNNGVKSDSSKNVDIKRSSEVSSKSKTSDSGSVKVDSTHGKDKTVVSEEDLKLVEMDSVELSPNQSISSESGSISPVVEEPIKPKNSILLNIKPEPQPIVPLGLPRKLLRSRKTAETSSPTVSTKASPPQLSLETKEVIKEKDNSGAVLVEDSPIQDESNNSCEFNPDEIQDFEVVDECL